MPRNAPVNDDDFDDDDDDDLNPPDPSVAMKAMRKRLRELEKSDKESAAIKRENAMLKAGVDVTSKLGNYFLKSYDGDLADLEAIKAEATEIGLLKSATTTTDPNAPATTATTLEGTPAITDPNAPADTSTADRRTLASGALPDDGKPADPRAEAMSLAEASIKRGGTFESAAGGFINKLAQSAMDGDTRVLVQANQ